MVTTLTSLHITSGAVNMLKHAVNILLYNYLHAWITSHLSGQLTPSRCHSWLADLAAPVGSQEVTDMPTNPHC